MPDPAYATAVAYVTAHHTPRSALAVAAGLTERELARLAEAGVLPEPTYRIGPAGVMSAIGWIGAAPDGEAFYGPSVIHWLRRARVLAEQVPSAGLVAALEAWLAEDLRRALAARTDEATIHGWGHLMRGGAVNADAVRGEVESYRDGWEAGGWAVCLRRFDGHHLATKEIERRRIAALTQDGTKPELPAPERLAVLDAMIRLDSVLLPFAPHERPYGTPGKFIDAVALRYDLPLPGHARRRTISDSPAAHQA